MMKMLRNQLTMALQSFGTFDCRVFHLFITAICLMEILK